MAKVTQRVNLFLDPELLKNARIEATNRGISLSQLVDDLIKSHIPTFISAKIGGGKSGKLNIAKY